MKKLNVLIAILFSMMMVACSSSPTSRSTGAVVDDAAITAKVKSDIATSTGLGEALSVNVDTYRGEVSLSGFVDNQQQVEAAGKAAKSVDGVKKVNNNLQVKPKP